MNDPMVYTETHLKQMKLVVLNYITQELADKFAIEPELAFSLHGKFMADDIVMRIVQKVYGREMERIEARYPSDWWQAFKERWFPAWAKRRWPVRETVVDLVARELYPKVAMPGRGPQVVLDYHERPIPRKP